MRGLLPIILAVAALAALAACAHAEEASGAEAIAHGENIDVSIDFYEGDWLDVSYQVTVVSGARVWVYFVPSLGYDEYIDPAQGSFTYYEYWSSLNTRGAIKEFALDEKDTYHLIIENSDTSEQAAYVQYRVSYAPGTEPSNVGLVACTAIAIIGIPVVIIAVVLILRRKARSATAFPGTTVGIPGQYPQQPGDFPRDPYGQDSYRDYPDQYRDPSDWGYRDDGYRDRYRDSYYDSHYNDHHYSDHHYGDHSSWGSSRGGLGRSSSRSHSSSSSPKARMQKRR